MSLKEKKNKIQKGKRKTVSSSSSSDDDSEHELSYYIEDRIKLMKQIMKILKPKKIKSMAPDCYKKLDISELNSMLLEELLGISNKRLKHILSGQRNVDYSSSESEDELKPIDVISLDDISTDEDLTLIEDNVHESSSSKDKYTKKKQKKKKVHVKSEPNCTEIKKEKPESSKNSKESDLMSVLELLELQARARAIRSQLALEAENKKQNEKEVENLSKDDSDPEAVILDNSKLNEIIISSSDSENEISQETTNDSTINNVQVDNNSDSNKNLNKDLNITKTSIEENNEQLPEKETNKENTNITESETINATTATEEVNDSSVDKIEHNKNMQKNDSENDDIILNLDAEREEIDNEILS